MKNVTSMSDLFDKLNDLKAIFHYGQKMIPIIQSLIDFMRETVPLLDNINNSIVESTAKIPKASNQISNVTSANELATTEILDLVDTISGKIFKAEEIVNKVTEGEITKTKYLNELLAAVKGNNEAEELVKKIQNIENSGDTIKPLLALFTEINQDVYNITLSLQVQDITAQQLAAVNHLIESVQSKLSSLLVDFHDANVKDFNIQQVEVTSNATYNPEARYEDSTPKQKTVDELLKKQVTTQEEIDKLFS